MDLPALQIAQPVINPAEQMQAARTQRIQDTSEEMRQRAATMEILASGAVYAHEGGPSGPVNPEKWNEVLDTFEAGGMPPDQLKAFRENPQMATILLRGSTAALKAAHDPMLYEMELAKLQAEIDKARAGPEPTADQKLLNDINRERAAKGEKPMGTEEFLAWKESLDGPGTVVNVGADGASGGASVAQFQKDMGSGFAKNYQTIQDQADAAYTALGTLDQMEQAMQDPNFYSGFGANQALMLKRFVAALGGNPEDAASMETFNALNKQGALAVMGGSLGTGFSNADRDFVTDQVPTLSNTPEGNTRLIRIQRKINQRSLEIADLANEYVAKHGVLDAGFKKELRAFAEANPLFAEEASQSDNGPAGAEPKPADEPPAMPKVGDVEDGYVFNGGDPSDPKNWTKAK